MRPNHVLVKMLRLLMSHHKNRVSRARNRAIVPLLPVYINPGIGDVLLELGCSCDGKWTVKNSMKPATFITMKNAAQPSQSTNKEKALMADQHGRKLPSSALRSHVLTRLLGQPRIPRPGHL